jgi:hypothetical protein
VQVYLQLTITARQYGEVVLPDDSTGQGPGTLARKLSRCKEGMAHFLPSRHRVLWPLRASRYRVVKELVNYPGAIKLIEGSGTGWVYHVVLSCLGSRSKSKNRDKQLTHIVRVMLRHCFLSGELSPLVGCII